MSGTAGGRSDAPLPLLTGRAVRDLLARHGLAPTRVRGQNFVVDPNTVRKVVRDAGVAPGDHVVEVGPGLGSLTLALLEAGADVTAVEIDHGLARALAEVVAPAAGRVRIVTADAVTVDYAALAGGRPTRMVANLPYNVATPIVVEALQQQVLEGLFVMVQREVGERWAAGRGDPAYGAVSVKLAALADVELVATVSPRAFWPVPRVDSVTVRLTPHPPPPARAALFALVDRGFSQRRKRLRNALADARHPPAAVEAALRAAGLDAGARAEELALDDWVALAEAF